MSRKLTGIVAVLLWCGVTTAPAANIIVVTDNLDRNLDGVADDQGLIDWLVAEGHSVDVWRNPGKPLDSQRVSRLQTADLVVVSPLAESSLYSQSKETTQWNSLRTPLLLLNACLAGNLRWNWIDSDSVTNAARDDSVEAMDPNHPVFRGVSLTALDESDPNSGPQPVPVVDASVGSGTTAFLGTPEVGNGRLIARTVDGSLGWIAEWDAGVEFYPGAGQLAGGKRLLFCAGTQDVNDAVQGEFNLTPVGRHVLRNAIAYLLGGANIIVVTEGYDRNGDGVRDDLSLEKFLVSEGHFVDIRPWYWRNLDRYKIAELQAADLILFSRTAESHYYSSPNEPPQWNALPVPLLQMNPNFTHHSQWNWVASNLTASDAAPASLEAIVPSHPIFWNVRWAASVSDAQGNPLQTVPAIDLNVGSGITSFSGTVGMGNGRLLAKPLGFDLGWIAEWDAGVEFYPGAGQFAGGKRLLFCAGTKEIQVVDPATEETSSTAQGELNLTPEGLQMFRNAIDYLLSSAPGPQP
jgi:hypothetical protein